MPPDLRRQRRAVAGLLAVLAIVPASALRAQGLTLERAVETALARNTRLRAARATVDEADARASEARAGFFPRIQVAETWQRGNQPVFAFSSLLSARRFTPANFAIDSLNHPDPTGFFRTSLGIEQSLFDGGRQRAVARAAAANRDAAAAGSDQAAADLALAVTEAFGRTISADAARRSADAALAAAREDVARAERRRDAGLATDADVLALIVQQADLQQRVIQAGGDRAIARAELNRLMGDPLSTAIEPVEPGLAIADEFDRSDLDRLLAESVGRRPEVARAAAATRAAEAARHEARAALAPQLVAQAAVEASGTRLADRASSWIVGGELRWTFSSGGGQRAAIRAAAGSLARAQAEAEDARTAAQVEVISALARFDAARAREAAGRAAVDQARESQRIVRDRVDAGMASVNDVLGAATAVLDANRNRTAALVDAIVARAMLRRALGRTP
jgi:outer membrane protein